MGSSSSRRVCVLDTSRVFSSLASLDLVRDTLVDPNDAVLLQDIFHEDLVQVGRHHRWKGEKGQGQNRRTTGDARHAVQTHPGCSAARPK